MTYMRGDPPVATQPRTVQDDFEHSCCLAVRPKGMFWLVVRSRCCFRGGLVFLLQKRVGQENAVAMAKARAIDVGWRRRVAEPMAMKGPGGLGIGRSGGELANGKLWGGVRPGRALMSRLGGG